MAENFFWTFLFLFLMFFGMHAMLANDSRYEKSFDIAGKYSAWFFWFMVISAIGWIWS